MFNNVAVVGGEIASDLLHGFLAFFRRQVAPAAVRTDVFPIHLARSLAAGDLAVGHGAAGLEDVGLLHLLLLLLDFLYEFVERLDDAILPLTDFLAGTAQVEPAADVVHPPGDVVECIVLQPFEVFLHEPGENDVASRAGLFALQQRADRLQAGILVQQGVVYNALVKQQRGGGRHVVGI